MFERGHPYYPCPNGHKMSEEAKKKLSLSKTGKHYPKLSEAMKKPERIQMFLNATRRDMKGKNHPMFGRKRPDIAEWNRTRNYKHSEQAKQNISKGLNKMHANHPEIRAKIGKSVQKYIKEHPEKWRLNKLMARNRLKITKSQMEWFLKVQNIVGDCHLEFPLRTLKTIRYCDIAIPSLNLDIEIDGSYWHNKQSDDQRDDEMKEIGWETVRIGVD